MSRAKAVFIPPAKLVVVARSSYPTKNAPETLSNVSGAFFAYAFVPTSTFSFFRVEGIAISGSPTT